MNATTKKTPTPSEIKAKMESREDSHFFDAATMRFFGDTMRNFGTYRHSDGTVRLFRKKPVKHGLTGEWIFDEQAATLTKVSA